MKTENLSNLQNSFIADVIHSYLSLSENKVIHIMIVMSVIFLIKMNEPTKGLTII
jgi:hypothetical protein